MVREDIRISSLRLDDKPDGNYTVEIFDGFILVVLVSEGLSSVRLLDINSNLVVAEWETKTKLKHLHIYPLSKKRVLVNVDDRWHLLGSLPQGPLLLGRIFSNLSAAEKVLEIELPEAESKKLISVLNEFVPIDKSLVDKITAESTPNSKLKTFRLPLTDSVVSGLTHLSENNIPTDSVYPLHIISEITKNTIGESQVNPDNLKPEHMNVELNRLKSFLYWPITEGPAANTLFCLNVVFTMSPKSKALNKMMELL